MELELANMLFDVSMIDTVTSSEDGAIQKHIWNI